ncbi:DUF4145 domain-containing protein [Pontibacillus yanchengensis]|uniref:DUF4145 domain-containing protein n=1 Tax=Pontibacillus yanchengensis TaxID=462910 RepID=A0A6I5A5Q7_9BACI|nr:DUF4145 domain-containing protein [Pontibacillus yanchengensis]MYL35572.1 DUF4145 domain-containing protein [Pontibacillus yanchengensis]
MDNNENYFYSFLEPLSKELAKLAYDLENSIYASPRTMLTHSRVFIENILHKVIVAESLINQSPSNLKERLDLLNERGYLTEEIRNALHHIRMKGNQAAHNSRIFRYSEALITWEYLYKIVRWYVEVYGPIHLTVPDYVDPNPLNGQAYESSELEVRLKEMENLLLSSMQKLTDNTSYEEVASSIVDTTQKFEAPGFTSIRTISYKGNTLEVPYFLRDAFLLPQRFDKSTTFLIRLGAEEQARIMSELPKDLEGLHQYVKRYSEKNDKTFFKELKIYIEQEKVRRQLQIQRPGELFFFYQDDYVVVTEKLSNIPLTPEEFHSIPSLLKQLNKNDINIVGQLPQELVILAKYENVGIGTVEKLFRQLKERQTYSEE